MTYEGGWQNNRPMGMHTEYRFVENIFEELDAPGEWYLDAKTHTLYFYPPAGRRPAHGARSRASRLRHLIEFRGSETNPVQCVTLRGLTFRHAARTFMDNREPLLRSDWTTYRGGAVLFDGAEDCALEDCSIDQVGGNAIFVNNYNRRVAIRGCHIAEAGANGVAFVGDPGGRAQPAVRVQPAAGLDDDRPHARAEDRQLSRRLPGGGLPDPPDRPRGEADGRRCRSTMAQDITVRHCSIYDVPRAGINIGDGCWGGHVIEFCDVFDTVQGDRRPRLVQFLGPRPLLAAQTSTRSTPG